MTAAAVIIPLRSALTREIVSHKEQGQYGKYNAHERILKDVNNDRMISTTTKKKSVKNIKLDFAIVDKTKVIE